MVRVRAGVGCHNGRSWIRVVRVVATAAVLTPGLLLVPTPASAWHQLTCPSSGSGVKWSGGSLRVANSAGSMGSTAVNAWSAAGSANTLVLSYSSPTAVPAPHVLVNMGNFGNAMPYIGLMRKPGTADAFPSCSGGLFTVQNEAVVNTYYATTANMQQAALSHEVGHSLGLQHNQATELCLPNGTTRAVAVLYQGSKKWANASCLVLLPRPDDAAGIDALY